MIYSQYEQILMLIAIIPYSWEATTMARKSLSLGESESIRLAAALMYCDDRSQEEIKTVLNLSQSAGIASSEGF